MSKFRQLFFGGFSQLKHFDANVAVPLGPRKAHAIRNDFNSNDSLIDVAHFSLSNFTHHFQLAKRNFPLGQKAATMLK